MDFNINKIFLINLAAFFCMVPYFSPFPLETDIQYPVIILCGLVILFDLYKNNIRFNNFELYFLFLSIVSFVYINPFIDFDYLIPKRVALLSAFMIFFVFSRYWAFINPKYLLAGVLINFSASILQMLSPEIFEYLQVFIGRAFTMSGFSYTVGSGWRGLTGLASEPAYLGGLSVVYFLVGYILRHERRISKKIFLLFSTVAITLNFLSMSGTSIIMMLFVTFSLLIFSNVKLRKKLFYLLGIVLILMLLIHYLGDTSRSLRILTIMFQDPLFIVNEYSTSLRTMSVAVGIESMIQGNIFGNGLGTLSYVATDIMERSSLKDLFNPIVMELGREKEPFSAIGLYITELGLLFIILLVWMYSRPLKSNYTNIVRIPIFLFIISAFSIMFPPFWLLMAATDKRANFNKNQLP